ncbi:MAG: glycosyl transferase family 2 [Cytophagaceae bacterium]|nr:glycosyl transferase family 2 [Cytophagaceae bacterium]
MEKLSVIIPVYNEAHNIEQALQTVTFADEIIVVDSFSSDDTLAVAKKYPVKILQRAFNYPASQKNWVIPQASHEWILLLDADERVTPALQEEIIETLKNPPENTVAFWIYRMNHFMGKRVKYSGMQNDKVIRLFKKSHCRYEDKMVHEEIETQGKVGFLKNRLLHNTYKNLDDYIAKLNRYAYWQARDYDKHTNRLNAFHFFVKPPWRFFKHFVIQQGFRDGVVGFTISFLAGYATALRYIKLWLYRRGQK